MNKIPAGLVKIAGITVLLFVLWALMAWYTSESFLKPNNIENLMRRTALYGVLGIGVAFVIISGGIDLSIGSVVCFSGCLLAILLEVNFRAVDQFPVISVAQTGHVVLAAGHSLEKGQTVQFEGGRRAQKLIATVVDVEKLPDGTSRVTVDKSFSRDDDAGVLVRLHPVTLAEPTQVTLNMDAGMSSGDEIWFVHNDKGLIKRKLSSSHRQEGMTILVIDEPIDIDNTWFAILQRRASRASVPVALLIVLAAGLMLGLVHGLLITKLNMQPFVVTLCSLLIFRSVSRWLASDQMVGFGNNYEFLKQFGAGKWMLAQGDGWTFGVPYPFFVLVVVTIAAMVLLNMTIWGRYMQALGRNEEAARYSGVNTDRNKILAYVICSGLAALGGVMFALDANSIAPYSFGNFFELYAIAAAVLGGCSLRGGEGGILGVIVGTALMQTLYNMIVLWKISAQLELAIVGVVILLGVMADEGLKRMTRRS